MVLFARPAQISSPDFLFGQRRGTIFSVIRWISGIKNLALIMPQVAA